MDRPVLFRGDGFVETNGPAIGAGCGLAPTCDLRVAGKRALLAETFVKLGIIPGDGGTRLLDEARAPGRGSHGGRQHPQGEANCRLH
ncbi:hypothetical protein HYG77_20495 [Rhodococcus sp. ZPP]|nr:hypothetical protein HYG77_20495 [Rhodococcus sp. ZPP]